MLLHGFTGVWLHWQPLLQPLAARYDVIAPTLAGHDGGGPYPLGSAITFADAADSLEAHLDRIGVGTAHIVGNSMGGALALELAKRGRARSVIALAPAGGWTPGDGEARRLARFFARQLRLTRVLAPRLPALMARPRLRRAAFRDVMRRGERVPAADRCRDRKRVASLHDRRARDPGAVRRSRAGAAGARSDRMSGPARDAAVRSRAAARASRTTAATRDPGGRVRSCLPAAGTCRCGTARSCCCVRSASSSIGTPPASRHLPLRARRARRGRSFSARSRRPSDCSTESTRTRFARARRPHLVE